MLLFDEVLEALNNALPSFQTAVVFMIEHHILQGRDYRMQFISLLTLIKDKVHLSGAL